MIHRPESMRRVGYTLSVLYDGLSVLFPVQINVSIIGTVGLRNSKDFVASGSNRLTGSNANTSKWFTRLLPSSMN